MNKYRLILSFIAIIATLSVFGQQKSSACKYLKSASESYCEENFKKSTKYLKKLVKNYPEHTLIDEANFAIASSFQKRGKNDQAEAGYLKLLELDNTQAVDSFGYELFDCNYMQAACRNILIPDFLPSLQHESCLNLASIAFDKGDVQSAYQYIRKADKKYRYWFGCGTGDYEEDMRLSQYYSRYYEAINQNDSALTIVLPYVFEPAAFPNMQYNNIIERTKKLLLTKYGIGQYKALLDTAIENIIQENLGDDHHTSYRYYVLFEGVYIPASPMYLFEHNGDKNEVIKFIKNTGFYQAIQ
ncbi:MAG: hypothetical protein HOD63_13700 [Bacteroidetes bacterium]|jgi:tetratricopeptide (TPR) repeat protein|nr:hypothetical protein [Bacteroidota bacterium]MBT5528772.1 hypothetical protein [Cytophagia bacterium]MBT3422090.1 hypothetical protein [Bacteroidota bacterium]MBT3800141.1 hypothetical protein [Bacteroidota bacterium]MBT3935929.1 hypothetical protein [Bacteroidota bacterium]